MSEDEWIIVPEEELSDSEKGHAGIKDLSEVTNFHSRREDGLQVLVFRFGDDAHHSVFSRLSGEIVRVESEGVRYERLGTWLVITKPPPKTASIR